jgi:hypothetical protein
MDATTPEYTDRLKTTTGLKIVEHVHVQIYLCFKIATYLFVLSDNNIFICALR